jgi:hypothetical protein
MTTRAEMNCGAKKPYRMVSKSSKKKIRVPTWMPWENGRE